MFSLEEAGEEGDKMKGREREGDVFEIRDLKYPFHLSRIP